MFTLPKNSRLRNTRTRAGRLKSTLGLMLLSCSLGACAVGPDFVRPGAPASQRYVQTEEPATTVAANGVAQHLEQGAPIPDEWWRLFNCPKLDALVIQSFAHNPTVEAAHATLRESEDNLRAGYGIFFPQLSAGFQPTRQQFSPTRFGSNTAPSIFSLYTLSATITYVLDVFGGQRRTVEGLRAQVDVQYQNKRGTYLTLSGNVVNAVVAEAAYQAEIQATQQLIGFLQEQESITAAQANAGVVPFSNLLSIQTELATNEATLPPLRQQVAHTVHLLSILAGREPGQDWAPAEVALSELGLPRDVPVSLPSDLVRKRPDILAAEAQLHTASAQVGVATAAMFPSFTLNANYGWNSTSLSNLFANNAEFWTLGAGIATPLIQGPTLWYQRKAAIDAYQQALANYRQTVLAALAQVADALDALQHDAQTLNAQSHAFSTAAELLRLTQINYSAGTVNYVQVLIADYQYEQANMGYIQAIGQRLQDTAALLVALGGGWLSTRVPSSQSALFN